MAEIPFTLDQLRILKAIVEEGDSKSSLSKSEGRLNSESSSFEPGLFLQP